MNANDKLIEQRAYLATHVDYIDDTLSDGIPSLKWCRIETSEFEKELNQFREVLTRENIPERKELKATLTALNSLTFYLMYLFVETWMNMGEIDVDPEYSPKVNMSRMKYAQQYSKALDHRQKSAAGFDGDGGGAARGANRSIG